LKNYENCCYDKKKAREVEKESPCFIHEYHHAHMTHSIGNMLQKQVEGTTKNT
jgi:hypothetical protein